MEVLAQDVESQVRSCVNLQLAGATINQNGMLSIKQLFNSMKRYGCIEEHLTFSGFIDCLESMRNEFNIRDGEIGVDVNYISIKKD